MNESTSETGQPPKQPKQPLSLQSEHWQQELHQHSSSPSSAGSPDTDNSVTLLSPLGRLMSDPTLASRLQHARLLQQQQQQTQDQETSTAGAVTRQSTNSKVKFSAPTGSLSARRKSHIPAAAAFASSSDTTLPNRNEKISNSRSRTSTSSSSERDSLGALPSTSKRRVEKATSPKDPARKRRNSTNKDCMASQLQNSPLRGPQQQQQKQQLDQPSLEQQLLQVHEQQQQVPRQPKPPMLSAGNRKQRSELFVVHDQSLEAAVVASSEGHGTCGSDTEAVVAATAAVVEAATAKLKSAAMALDQAAAAAAAAAEEATMIGTTAAFSKRVAKSQATRDLLRNVLRNNFLFTGASPADLELITEHMTSLTCTPGQVICAEGDQGDQLFVIEHGQLAVSQSKCPEQVDMMMPGRIFGELALCYQSPRAATVQAATESQLWSLHRNEYQSLGMDILNRNLDKRVEQLRQVNAFKDLTHAQLRRVSAVMQEESFPVGDVICRQGQIPERGVNDKFYTIASGTVEVTVDSSHRRDSNGGSVGVPPVAVQPITSTASPGSSPLPQPLVMRAHARASISSIGSSTMDVSNGRVSPSGSMSACSTTSSTFGRSSPTHTLLPSLASAAKVAQLGPGEWFGEMALLRDEPRTANVIAEGVEVEGDGEREPTKCYTLTRGAFEQIVSDSSAISTIASKSEVRKEDTNEVVLRHQRKQLASATTLHQLHVDAVIGEGGFSVVRLAQHPETGEVFALKIMNKADLAARFQQEHVRNERKILGASSHPFILSLIRTFKDQNQLYMLLELVQGGELFSRVTKSNGGLPLETVRFYAACVAEGLAYLHKKGIAYRDLKLENLVIDRDGYPKIIDFGFAKQLAPGETTRTLCGTPDYLAPEAVTRQGHNHMVDCWGLGVLVYEMITQCSPFADPQGGNQMAVFRRIMHGPDALDWSLFVGKYESALLHEMRNGGALVEWINRDYTNTRDMLHCLWAVNPNQRMTCSKLKEHPYFPPEMSWADLREKKVPAPWVPELTSPADTRYFDVEDFHHVRESGNVYNGSSDWFEEFGEDPDLGNGSSSSSSGDSDEDATMAAVAGAGDVDVEVNA